MITKEEIAEFVTVGRLSLHGSLINQALDIITQLQAEIERLTEIVKQDNASENAKVKR